MRLKILPQRQIRQRPSEHQIHQTPPGPQPRQTPRDHHTATKKHARLNVTPRLLLIPPPLALVRPPRDRVSVLDARGLREQDRGHSEKGAAVCGEHRRFVLEGVRVRGPAQGRELAEVGEGGGGEDEGRGIDGCGGEVEARGPGWGGREVFSC